MGLVSKSGTFLGPFWDHFGTYIVVFIAIKGFVKLGSSPKFGTSLEALNKLEKYETSHNIHCLGASVQGGVWRFRLEQKRKHLLWIAAGNMRHKISAKYEDTSLQQEWVLISYKVVCLLSLSGFVRNIKRHICPLSFRGFAEKHNLSSNRFTNGHRCILDNIYFVHFALVFSPGVKKVFKKNIFFKSLENWIIMWNFDQSIQAAMRRGGHNPTDIEVSQIQKLIVNIYVKVAKDS